MSSGSAQQWESLERWSPTLFLLAGVVLVGYATLNGIGVVTDMAFETVKDIVGPAGFVLGFVGLLGLYPSLADRSPTLARTGGACAVLGAVGFSVIVLLGLVQLMGVEPYRWLAGFTLLAAIGMIPGFLSFGGASLRADIHSRIVGFLLMAPAVIFASMASQAILFAQFGVFTETTMAWSAFAISGGQALAYLALGYTLRTERTPTDQTVRSGDAAVS